MEAVDTSDDAAQLEEPFRDRRYRPNQSPYRVRAGVEIPLVVATFGVAGLSVLAQAEGSGPWCGLDCDPQDINPLDRLTVGLASQTAGDVSDVLLYSSLSLPLVFETIDVATSRPHDGWRGFGTDILVLFETMGVSFWLNTLVSQASRRPRPFVYNDSVDDELRLKGTSALSFYSGHASTAFAAATAYSRLFMLRHPNSPLVAPMWIFTYAIATGVAAMRVVYGAHFITDVVVGAAVGVAVGLFIPWLHELPGDKKLSAKMRRSGIRMRPYFAGGSAGFVGRF